MKTSLNLKRLISFYMTPPASDLGVCFDFVGVFGINTDKTPLIKLSLSTKNPKTKGWKKITRIKDNMVFVAKKKFEVCTAEREFLDGRNIKTDQSFWVKIEPSLFD